MPPLPNVPKVIRVDLFETFGVNTRVRDRLFFQYTGAGGVNSDVSTFLTTFRTAWGTSIAPLFNTASNLGTIQATDLTSASAVQVVNVGTTSGTRAGGTLPTGVCIVVKEKIARRYRGGHPRVYLGAGVVTDLADQKTWSSTFVSLVAGNWQTFINAATASPPVSLGTLTAVNVSYFSGFTVVAPAGRRARNVPTARAAPVIDVILSYTANGIVASQRRRYQQSP